MHKTKKSLTLNLLLLTISVLAVLLTAEIVIRFAWEMSGWVRRPIYRRSFNPYLRYELVPGAQYGDISINLDGFRGREYPLQKPDRTFRILMLGDSETFSIMLSENKTLPVQLENMLNSQASDVRFEVLNFGVEGYNTLQELEQLKVKGLKYSPDLIILNYCLNDPEPGEYFFNKTFFVRHSALVRYFSVRIKKAMIKRERKKLGVKTELDHFNYLYQPKFFVRVKEAILEMADIAASRGSKLVVVIIPGSSLEVKDFLQDYPYKKMHALVKNIPSERIVFIDAIDEFNRLGLTPRSVSINYQENESHKNAAALGVLARYIDEIIIRQRLIPHS